MREDASCKKQAHRFRTVGMLCTAKSGSEESLPTVALCTHDRRPVVPAAQKLGHADDVAGLALDRGSSQDRDPMWMDHGKILGARTWIPAVFDQSGSLVGVSRRIPAK